MEKKIIKLVPLLLLLLGCTTFSNKDSENIAEANREIVASNYDTILIANEKNKKFKLNIAESISNGVVFKTKRGNKTIWLDSLIYLSQNDVSFFLIASTPENEIILLYFNGDSTLLEKVAVNKPGIKEIKLSSSTIISVTDSSFNSGYLIKSILFYQIDRSGVLKNKKEYFSQKKEGKGKFDLILNSKIINDTLVIFRNDTIDYKYY